MPTVIGVVFKKAGKVYYFDSNDIPLESGDSVIVKTSQGVEVGEVVSALEETSESEIVSPLKKILRKVTKEDLKKMEKNQKKEEKAFKIAEKKIEKHKLSMKLVDVEYMFDGGKIIFYFSADGRVDFRKLVKDLATVFKTRIELRQIGVRDEAKMLGGIGPCGRRLCCATFLRNFEPVSVKIAKDQNMPLNPFKISGICGRLMCCLRYEHEEYQRFSEIAPNKGSEVKTPKGVGKVVEYNVPRESIVVEISPGLKYDIPLDELRDKNSKEK